MSTYFSNDIELIRSLKSGDNKAYKFLLENYHKKLFTYALSLTNDHDLSEDIVQNTFINLWKNRANLKESFTVRNYLYRTVYNEFIDQYRKQKKVTTLEKKYIDALTYVLENESDSNLSKAIALVKKEIEKLPPKCKKTFLLSKQEGLTNIEIAEYLNVSIKSVEAHITKAFRILRSKLEDKLDAMLFLLFTKRNEKVSNVFGF